MSELLKRQVTVNGLKNSSEYTFNIPGIFDEVKIGLKMQDVRRRVDPTWEGLQGALDWQTQELLRAAATFEVLLTASSEAWPFSKSPTGAPIVDSSKFPDEKYAEVLNVFNKFGAEVARFRETGIADNGASGAETVAG